MGKIHSIYRPSFFKARFRCEEPHCKEEIVYADRVKHFQQHKTNKIICPFEPTSQKMFDDVEDLKNHFLNECPEIPHRCSNEYCNATMFKAQIEAHECLPQLVNNYTLSEPCTLREVLLEVNKRLARSVERQNQSDQRQAEQ